MEIDGCYIRFSPEEQENLAKHARAESMFREFIHPERPPLPEPVKQATD